MLDYFSNNKAINDVLTKSLKQMNKKLKASFILACYVSNDEDLELLENSVQSLKSLPNKDESILKERFRLIYC